jgi:hypothetical protein
MTETTPNYDVSEPEVENVVLETNYHAGHCARCGGYSPALDADEHCPDCASLPATQFDDLGMSEYAAEIASRVRQVVEPWHTVAHPKGIEIDVIDQIVSEALCQMHNDIRRGRKVTVEYFGEFEQIPGGVRFKAEAQLLKPLGIRLVAGEEAA